MNVLEVLSPVPATRTKHGTLAPRLTRLAGRRLGLLDNLKANAGDLLRQVAAHLGRAGQSFDIVTVTKNATAAAPASVMAHLKQCDAVILAIAD